MTTEQRREFLKTAAAASAGCLPLIAPAWCTAMSETQGQSDEQRFLAAAAQGDLATVGQLLRSNPSLLNSRDEHGLSAYARALLNGHNAVADYLKEAGYKSDLHESALALDWPTFDGLTKDREKELVRIVNAPHAIGGTAMYAAAAGGAGHEIWRVYAVCGDPDASPLGRLGISPLQKALRYPDLQVAEITAAFLLANNANPNPPANADLPPLHIAAERGSAEAVGMLIRLGADAGGQDGNGKSAKQVAQAHRHSKIVDLLIHQADIPRTCRTSRTRYTIDGHYQAPDISDIPLTKRRALVGQSHGNLDYVTNAVNREPRLVYSAATTSEICVEACAHTGRKPIVDFLLNHGATYSLPTAVMMNDMTTVKRYLDEDANRIHERGAHDFAPLWYCVIGNCPLEMMQLLLDRGAQVEEQHFLGTTALHWAVMRDNVPMTELLIAAGADVNRRGRKFDAAGETPLMLARNQKMIALLKAHGAV